MPTTATLTFVGQKLEPIIFPEFVLTDSVKIKASQNIPRGTIRGEVSASLGTFAPYAVGNGDGTGVALAIAIYDMQTDAGGLITYSDTSGQVGGEFQQQSQTAPLYFAGYFDIDDLVGLDSTAITQLGRVMRGGSSHGILAVR